MLGSEGPPWGLCSRVCRIMQRRAVIVSLWRERAEVRRDLTRG